MKLKLTATSGITGQVFKTKVIDATPGDLGIAGSPDITAADRKRIRNLRDRWDNAYGSYLNLRIEVIA